METPKTATENMEILLKEKDKLIETLKDRNRFLESQNLKNRIVSDKTLRAIIKLEDDLHNIRNSLICTLLHGESGAEINKSTCHCPPCDQAFDEVAGRRPLEFDPHGISQGIGLRFSFGASRGISSSRLRNGQDQSTVSEAEDNSNKHPAPPSVDEPANMRTDTEKEIIRLIGDGMSVSREIRIAAVKKTGASESTIIRYIITLKTDGIIECVENITFPGSKPTSLCKLTQKGKQLYRELYGNNPATPEMEKLKSFYGNYEIGYGVRACGMLLRSSGLFENVAIYPESIEIDEDTLFQPHIVCKTKAGKPQYFEYQRCRQREIEYFARFEMLSKITDEMNIIVANPAEHDRMQLLLAKWANKNKNNPVYRNKVIRLTNYNRIRECVKKGKLFSDWWYVVDKIKDFRPPLGYEGPLGKGI